MKKKLELVFIGHKGLRQKPKVISRKFLRSKSFQTLLVNMVRMMAAAQGVGLAANQVAQNKNLFVMECQKNKRYPRAPHFPLQAYINPKIIQKSRRQVTDWEGCLSIPGYRGLVPRAHEVTFEAWLPSGQKIRRRVKGFEARVVQHECDHLNGLFYVDRMPDLKKWVHVKFFNP